MTGGETDSSTSEPDTDAVTIPESGEVVQSQPGAPESGSESGGHSTDSGSTPEAEPPEPQSVPEVEPSEPAPTIEATPALPASAPEPATPEPEAAPEPTAEPDTGESASGEFPDQGPNVYDDDQAAFPGALGHGRNATGGRGGRVVIVNTTQNVVNSGDGLMSLREAMTVETGPRYVVFAVGGLFDMGNDWLITDGAARGDVTLACQTAPSPGVIIKSAGVMFNRTNNIIMRHCIIRNIDPGAPNADSGRGIGVGGPGSHSMIFDHLSISWATDENFQIYSDSRADTSFYDFTLSNTIISEGDARSNHSQSINGEREQWDYHSMGPSCNANGQIGIVIKGCSIVNNLIANNSHRNGMLWGSTGEIVNNIVYNWNMMGSTLRPHTVGRTESHIVNNLYKAGPSTRSGGASNSCGPQCAISVEAPNSIDQVSYTQVGEYRLVDNYYWATSASSASLMGSIADATGTPVDAQRTPATRPIVEMAEHGSSHMRCLGASRPLRDVVDNRVVSEFHAGTGMVGISDDHNRDYSAYPAQVRHAAGYDTDGDGMGDQWERENGLNPNDASDYAGDPDGDGYPNIEEFINYMARCH